MRVTPPPSSLLDLPPQNPMELFGRMCALTRSWGYRDVLPIVWQCSDESQGIKKALFGYIYDTPVFNLGRVGAIVDPTRLEPAAHHGRDLVIFGGSHIGGDEVNGFGHLRRIHGVTSPCCGLLARVLKGYLDLYRRATTQISLRRNGSGISIIIPYPYLLAKPAGTAPRIQLHLPELVAGPALRETGKGKEYPVHPRYEAFFAQAFESQGEERQIGSLLRAEHFCFVREFSPSDDNPQTLIEQGLFDFMAEIVSDPHPHRRLVDLNTWWQFHRLCYHLTNRFDGEDRNIFVVAGRTIDDSIHKNRIVPQYAFHLPHGDVSQATYFDAGEITGLLNGFMPHRPSQTFLEYAQVD